MLTVRGLVAGYGASRILQGIDLDLGRGEILAILGRNGAGRSTLLKALAGQLPAEGQVTFDGTSLIGLPAFAVARRGVAWVPEDRGLFAGLSVEENLLLGLPQRSRGIRAEAALAPAWALAPVLRDRRHLAAGKLSGGEQQLLALARAMLAQPALLLVDEPCEGLAPRLVGEIATCLAGLRAAGTAIVLVEQKLAIALELADRVAVLGHGRVVFAGTPTEFSDRPHLTEDWLQV